MNIIAIIDKKISNVAINIPPIQIPQPKIIISTCKDNHTNNDKQPAIDVEYESNNDKNHQINNKKDNIENFEGGIVTVTSNKKNKSLDNPSKENIVNYTKNIISIKDKLKKANNMNKKTSKKVCENDSIQKKHQWGKHPMKANQLFTNKKFHPASYYKYYKPMIGQMEDYKIKGANYTEYKDSVEVNNVGVRLLPKNNKKLYPKQSKIDILPKAHNFMF